MKTKSLLSLMMAIALLLVFLSACQKAEQEKEQASPETQLQQQEEDSTSQEETNVSYPQTSSGGDPSGDSEGNGQTMIYAHIGDDTLSIKPADNSSAEPFAALLQEGDLTVAMRDYGSFEKVGHLGTTLPTNDESITTSAAPL